MNGYSGNEGSLEALLSDIYRSEINISITSFWDDGYTVKLGDEMNGFRVTLRVRDGHNIVDLPAIIKNAVIRYYPNSDFAKRHKED